MRSAQVLISLGLNGDLMNTMCLARHLAKTSPVRILTCKEHAPLLEGTSYAVPMIWPWGYSKLMDSVSWLRRHGVQKPVICQSYCHPDRSTDISYQEDAYRLAGFQNLFGTLPLVFDRRNKDREWKLMENIPVGKKWIAVSTQGISSPCPSLKDLIPTLVQQYPEYEIVDLSTLKAHRLFDMIGVLDGCSLLISIDTVWLHLARSSSCPVIAVLNDLESWRSSVPPPATVVKFGYKTVSTDMVVEAVGQHFNKPIPTIYHAAQIFGTEERHLKAYQSWKKLKERGMIGCYTQSFDRTFDDNGRKLPFLRDILQPALDQMESHDVVLWSNDDCQLRPEILDWCKNHVGTYGAATIQRDADHQGRDGFAATKQWLTDNPLPDVVIGAPKFDLLLTAMVREKRGVKTTLENLAVPFFPCENKIYIRHEPHQENWTDDSPAALHNGRLLEEWLREHGMRIF